MMVLGGSYVRTFKTPLNALESVRFFEAFFLILVGTVGSGRTLCRLYWP